MIRLVTLRYTTAGAERVDGAQHKKMFRGKQQNSICLVDYLT